MAGMKSSTSSGSSVVATIIGDVVGSRSFPDRAELHRRISAALAAGAAGALDPPALTVGDEFQGSYDTVGHAIDAALAIRLALAPEVDIRFGIGWGDVARLDPDTGIQDGPGWWSAREAIEWTAVAQQQSGMTRVRTAYRAGRSGGPDPAAINAALMCRDHLLGSLDERSLRILAGLREGKSKKELAMAEGISASAVSQRAGRDGLDLLVASAEQLRELR
jgi:hypothetical protein